MPDNIPQTVLVVDDVVANIDLLVDVLQDDYKVKVALNGETALDIAASPSPPDIILLDVMMPGMDGYEVCDQLKCDIRTSSIPVIFVTAKGEEKDEARGFATGAVDYITKPINPTLVRARVGTHLALHNQSLALEKEVDERTRELASTRREIIRRLGIAAEYKDNETGIHIMRMSRYCGIVAAGLGFAEREVNLILDAAPMHDVGKIGIPDDILHKPAKLTPAEWEIMKTHTTIGATIIGEHDHRLLKVARTITLTHHERWDGTGYPNGLAGTDIPIEGRISALADVFDALLSVRPYKEPWPLDKTLELIRDERGKHFDPQVVDVFFANLDQIKDVLARNRE